MMSAPLPFNEQTRLSELFSYDILDAAPEACFDDVASVAASICGTPIALVSLLDETRQWFMARYGLGMDATHRDLSFCGHAILQSGVFEVADAYADERFHDNPLVTGDPFIRFYAAAPLVTPSGFALGTVCVIDTVPRRLSEVQRSALQALAHQIVIQLELRKVNGALVEQVNRSRDAARIIKEQQARLVQTEKMASLGEMCAGLSHEINNPLSVIYGKTEQLRMYVADTYPQDPLISGHLDSILRNAMRIGSIVKGLRSFAREGDDDPMIPVPVDAIFADVRNLVWERFRMSGVVLNMRTPDEPVRISCRQTQISQILFNLLSNAFDAVQDAPEKRVDVECRLKGEEVEIRVSDSGPGVSEELRSRIMEPFFTTKPVGKGTGLGLSISSGLAQAHGGSLALELAPGPTVFLLKLPLHQELSDSFSRVLTLH